MNFRFCIFLLFVCAVFQVSAQKEIPFGRLSPAEQKISDYPSDTTANAVVLYEKGANFFKVINRRVQLVKLYHAKIKILNDKGFDEADISIPYYHTKNTGEQVNKIKAVTHNGLQQTYVSRNDIFTNDLSERVSEKRFTFSNVKKGSVLEYQYELTSPYLFNLTGWEFQSHIPKVYSEFNAKIPANYKYNRSFVGKLKLDTNEADIQKNCFYVEGYPNPADCEVLQYTMKDIPAFRADDQYMLAASNYISRIDFELSEYQKFNGDKEEFTRTWKAVDSEFRSDKDIGRQLTKTGFFEKNVPESLLTEGDDMTRAKNVYKFVQEHYTWNGKHSTYGKARVKDAFNAKKGNAWEINMSLINLLNAAGIKTNLMLTSTRKNGLPKRSHPVMSDFNYVIAKTEIDGKTFLLDATDKYMPFGMLPYKTLNHYGRVMDFKNESYWHAITPFAGNKYQVRGSIKFDIENQNALGVLDVTRKGYAAVSTNKRLNEYSEESYLAQVEKSVEGDFMITDYKKSDAPLNTDTLRERFSFEIEGLLGEEMVYINPFLIRFFEENPFQMENRQYPVDFGYPMGYKYAISIEIPDGYTVHELPKKEAIALGEDRTVTLRFNHDKTLNSISLSFDLTMNESHFAPENYTFLKELFKKVTNVQKNSLVVLKKG